MNENQNLNNNTVQSVAPPVVANTNTEKKSTGVLWLLPVALLISGGIFKAVSLLINMASDAGGEVKGVATAIKIMDILPLIAWVLVVPAVIYAAIRTAKNKKK